MRHRRKSPRRSKSRRKSHTKSRRRRSIRASSRGASQTTQTEGFNRKSYWNAYRHLAQRAQKAMQRLRADVQRNANPATLIRDRNNVLLILAECNYMARECTRLSVNQNRRGQPRF